MSLTRRLLFAFTMRETAMFGLGMSLTGLLTIETADGFWAVLVGLLIAVLSVVVHSRERAGKDSSDVPN